MPPTELGLLAQTLTRSADPSTVADRLAAMSSTEHQRLHTYVLNRGELLRGYDRRSNAQDDELAALEALSHDIRGAERDHIRALLGDGEPTATTAPGKIERGTPLNDVDGYSTPSAPSREPAPLIGRTMVGNADRGRQNVDALHRSGTLPDYAAERVERLIVGGSLRERSVAAGWAATAGDPHYTRAFAKLVSDPVKGHLLWNEQERAAYQAVEEFRAMSLTDAAGGHMVPLTLDPAILLTSDGSINPLRRLSRVVQTATDQWKGVNSAGVTAEWKAESVDPSTAANGSQRLRCRSEGVPLARRR